MILLFNLGFILLGILGRDWPNELLISCDVVIFAALFYMVDRIAKAKKR